MEKVLANEANINALIVQIEVMGSEGRELLEDLRALCPDHELLEWRQKIDQITSVLQTSSSSELKRLGDSLGKILVSLVKLEEEKLALKVK